MGQNPNELKECTRFQHQPSKNDQPFFTQKWAFRGHQKKEKKRANQRKRKIRLMSWLGQKISLVTLILQPVEMTNCK